MNFLIAVLGGDMNTYGVARAFFRKYKRKLIVLGKTPLYPTSHSKIVEPYYYEDILTSTEYGNFTGVRQNTGSSDQYRINNIYDLYGCHYEWTLEASGSNNRAERGGYSWYSFSPASRDNYYPNYAVSNYSSRATLYVK